MPSVHGEGPIPARIMLVGEAPGVEEERTGTPFVGESGKLLNKMLEEAGVNRSECFVTNVARERPLGNDINNFIAKAKKDRSVQHKVHRGKYVLPCVTDGCRLLAAEISMVKPNVIVALGGVPLWALTGLSGIQRWRGSMLYTSEMGTPTKLIPTIHPAAILREWSWRATAVHDLRRAAQFRDGSDYPKPGWNFEVRPTAGSVLRILGNLEALLENAPTWLSVDIETAAGHIDCIGIAWTAHDALCIPFVERGNHYWGTPDEEAAVLRSLRRVLVHPNARCIFQNGLYDVQYIYRHWFYIPNVAQDTMLSWHTMFAGLPKKLDFQASMLCEHYKQWKPDRSKQKEGG